MDSVAFSVNTTDEGAVTHVCIFPERRLSAFPDGNSALVLVATQLRHIRHIAGTKWGTRRYLDTNTTPYSMVYGLLAFYSNK